MTVFQKRYHPPGTAPGTLTSDDFHNITSEEVALTAVE